MYCRVDLGWSVLLKCAKGGGNVFCVVVRRATFKRETRQGAARLERRVQGSHQSLQRRDIILVVKRIATCHIWQ